MIFISVNSLIDKSAVDVIKKLECDMCYGEDIGFINVNHYTPENEMLSISPFCHRCGVDPLIEVGNSDCKFSVKNLDEIIVYLIQNDII